MSAPRQIFDVEHALGEPAEEARHAALQHLAARTEQSRLWRNGAAQRQQVGFITAGAVQEQ